MKDYKKIIKYLEKAQKLMVDGDEVDLQHAFVNIQFAIQDLHVLDMHQDDEMKDIIKSSMEKYNA